MNIIGRELEKALLQQLLDSGRAEFIAVYGRRRVGKTFLIEKFFAEMGIYITCSGIKDGTISDQLFNFTQSFQDTFYPNLSLKTPQSWREAFMLLTTEMIKISPHKRIIVFLDELPWLAKKKSNLLQSLDYFWNAHWSKLPNFKLIVCGSAASRMLSKLINAKGGLHNRVTKAILIQPFSLGETKQYLAAQGVRLNERQILDVYMVTGGVPFYLSEIQRSESVAQNINRLCFRKDGLLYQEFPRLFKSLFDAAELNLRIIREIAKYRYGVSFAELVQKTGKSAGGRFKERLQELEAAGFIQQFLPYGKEKRNHYYKVIDEYSLFYLKWIESLVEGALIPKGADYWSKISKTPSWQSWAGYVYEDICLKHSDKIIRKLGLGSVNCYLSNWCKKGVTEKNEAGAQIDLLIDRDDDAISVCEIKYNKDLFEIDKNYATSLMNKVSVFKNHFKITKQIFLVMITVSGVKKNLWAKELVDVEVKLSDLF